MTYTENMSTPWGRADEVITLDEGFYSVSTPSHGGLMLTADYAMKNLSAPARRKAEKFCGFYCYEEDCLVVIPIYEIICSSPSKFQEYHFSVESCIKSLSMWNPDYLIARKIALDPVAHAINLERKEDARLRLEKSPDLIIAARGDWYKECNPGEVEVVTADEKVHYVTAESYKQRTGLNLLSKCVLAR